jgi:acetate kinase
VRVLTVNAGSSSLKLRVLATDDVIAGSAELPAADGEIDRAALAAALDGLPEADAAGHRIVHGGASFTAPTPVDDSVLADLHRLVDLAPLHLPVALEALSAVTDLRPHLPAVACFDTAFHATLPAAAATYALPERWRRLGVRRYGFHGLSHAYASRRATEVIGRTELRIITCHLGAGASLAAVRDGRSVDTTMGFTPVEGLVMASRSGSVDPGALVWLQRHAAVEVGELDHALEHESGLRALAGTADMRKVVERADTGDAAARLALDVYVHRLRGSVAAMAAALTGIDALVFTGGVGERSPRVRERAATGLAFLGVAIDETANAAVSAGEDAEVSAPGAAVRTLVVSAREDLEIARGVRTALGA